MNRKQVYLTEHNIEVVKEAATKKGICFSEMLRNIIDAWEGEGK